MNDKKILKKILIADDEPNVRLLVHRMLSKSYEVLEAGDGQEAIDIARAQQPALILMDIMMPRVDGYTACSTLKTDQATKDIPVIMLSGIDFELNKKLADGFGASGYITKPFDSKELLKTVGKFVEASD